MQASDNTAHLGLSAEHADWRGPTGCESEPASGSEPWLQTGMLLCQAAWLHATRAPAWHSLTLLICKEAKNCPDLPHVCLPQGSFPCCLPGRNRDENQAEACSFTADAELCPDHVCVQPVVGYHLIAGVHRSAEFTPGTVFTTSDVVKSLTALDAPLHIEVTAPDTVGHPHAFSTGCAQLCLQATRMHKRSDVLEYHACTFEMCLPATLHQSLSPCMACIARLQHF